MPRKKCTQKSIPMLLTRPAELFKTIPKRGKLKEFLVYGETLMTTLTEIYEQVLSVSSINLWPKEYQPHARAHSMLWKNMLYYLLSTDENRNTRMCNYATEIFKQLSFRINSWKNWRINLWVVLCECISEFIEDDELFKKVIEVILNSALDEKSRLGCRLVDTETLLSENAWHIMCMKIIPLIKDEFVLCNIALLLLALSGEEKSKLHCYLKKSKEVNSNDTLLTILMTEESWENIVQVIELLKQKRELIQKLSYCTAVELTDNSTKPALIQSCIDIPDENTQIQTKVGEEYGNLKPKPNTHDFILFATKAIKHVIKNQKPTTITRDFGAFDNSSDKPTKHVNVKRKPIIDIEDFNAFDNSSDKLIEHGNSVKEPATDTPDVIAFDNSTGKAIELASVDQETATDRPDIISFYNNTDKAKGTGNDNQEPETDTADFIALNNSTNKPIGHFNVKLEPTTDTPDFISLDNSIDKIKQTGNVKRVTEIDTADFIPLNNSTNKAIMHVNIKQETTSHSPVDSSTNKPIGHFNVKLEPTTDTPDFISFTIGTGNVKQEPETDTCDFITFDNSTDKAIGPVNVKQEAEANTQNFIALNNVKQEIETDKQVTDIPQDMKIKKEDINTKKEIIEEQEENLLDNPINEEDIIIVDAEEKTKEDEPKLSLDNLILEYSVQEINKSSGNITVIDLIDLSEDENDCSGSEDKKIPVEQLLTMYQDMVSNKPLKLVKNPLSDLKSVQEESEEMLNPKEFDFLAPSTSQTPDRKPSTTSAASINSKMTTPMSTNKQQKKIKKKRSKTNENVQKLFKKLRDESQASTSTAETTVIEVDKTVSYTPKYTPKKSKAANKRKYLSPMPCGKSKRKKERYYSRIMPEVELDSSLVINDVAGSSTPQKASQIHCSTPVANKNNKNPDFIPIKKKLMQPNNNTSTANNLNEEITDLTKEINRDSYLTIDLTAETLNCSSISKAENTVIDLENSIDNADCTVISVHDSNANLSISGESDVTVLNMSQEKKDLQMRKFAKGIAKLDASEKGRLLELITQNIFSGCNVVNKKGGVVKEPESSTRATETVEDTYIKEVILGQASCHNSIGSNIYNPERDVKNKMGLRMVVIDGSNVAMEHGRGTRFSVKGLKICIDYFLNRGHVVKAFVPRFRCKYGKSTDPRLLDHLERQGLVVYTPSREIQGRTVTSYDDRYIVQCAAEFDGVIVSGDNYRDLMNENPRWRFVIENRLLQFTWVNDMIMFPKDPLGRHGPTLEQFLKHFHSQTSVNGM